MWIPLLAGLAVGLVSVQKCQRGPGLVLGAARLLAAAVPGLCQRTENRCTISNAETCTKCLTVSPECGWCTQEDFMNGTKQKVRCDIISHLIARGCRPDFIESLEVDIMVSNSEVNIQVTPGEISIQLYPGSEASFILKVHPLEKYPVDLYYLVDVSASMHKNIEKLYTVGFDLSQKMEKISLDLRLGFGSYVDKTVTPYISIHPGRIHNQCSDYNLDCIPPHGYINVLSLTDKIKEFRSAINRQKISGNIDTPEGGFDAMLQAAVCQSQIGWRREAKHLLLMMTDQTSHLALDSKLAGIVVPNDGNCHLKDNVYVKATSMEHPSLGQLSEKLIDNNINVIFAVQGSQFHWYKDLLPMLPGTIARQIESQAANLSDLVVDSYELLSEVKIQVDNSIQDIHVNVTAICPDGSRKTGFEGCKNVKFSAEVLFNISIAMKGCGAVGGRKYVMLKPIGFNESTKVNIHTRCSCQCEDSIKHRIICSEETFLDADMSSCNGHSCSSSDELFFEQCKMQKNHPVCSGQGDCIGGQCVCHKTKLGLIYGKYCEKDDFSCPYHLGILCAGNGECEAGKCRCFDGWEGDRCQCSSTLRNHCLNSNGQICSGRGTCVCGECKCTDYSSFGHLCEFCPTCGTICREKWNCLPCHHTNSSQITLDQCKASCTYRIHYTEKSSECIPNDPSHCRIFFIIFIVTFLFGLLNVLIIRQIVLQWSSNKLKSSADYRVSAAKKDNMFLPAVCTKTVTYRRDKPEEINISPTKLQVNETFKCDS
ncbi:integrin beta-8 isoform X2 [Sphaerodactylus townsendi]|uniref:integrin beta-8 isoform X2 n=1 Tax=Sphaerodactylus townsendi TaxID=933632 RepID=UPI002026F25E|nr:integrin beta-8 isoform X2 [Sphaerodactylus townsendi]